MLGSLIATEIRAEDPLGSVPLRKGHGKGSTSGAKDPPAVLAAVVTGQFEDADDEEDQLLEAPKGDAKSHHSDAQEEAPSKTESISTAASTCRNPLDFLAAACNHEELTVPSNKKAPPMQQFQRRISSTTCDATNSLMRLANTVVTSNDIAPKPIIAGSGGGKGGRKTQKTWQVRVKELVDFKKKHGHLKIRQASKGNLHHKELGAWLANARCRYKAGKLHPERADYLHTMGCDGFCPEDLQRTKEEIKASWKQDDSSSSNGSQPPMKKTKTSIAAQQKGSKPGPKVPSPASLPKKSAKAYPKLDRGSCPYPPPEAAKHPLVRAIWGVPPPEEQSNARAPSEVRRIHGPIRSHQASVLRGHEASAARRQSVPKRNHEAPVRSYEAPVRSYEAPVRSYDVPIRNYEVPIRNYEAPVRRRADPDGRRGEDPDGALPAQVYADDGMEMNRAAEGQPLPLSGQLSMAPSHLSALGPPRHAMSMLGTDQTAAPVPSRMDPLLLSLNMLQRQPALAQPSIAALRERVWLEQHRRASHASSYTQSSHNEEERAVAAASEDHASYSEDEDTTSEGDSRKCGKKTWPERMMQMREFFLTYHHCQVSTRGQYRDLGRWLSTQRGKARAGTLPPDRLEELMSMQDWTADNAAQFVSAGMKGQGTATRREDPPEEGSAPSEHYSDDEDEKSAADGQQKPGGAEITSAATPYSSAPSSPSGIRKRKRPSRVTYAIRLRQIKAFKAKHGHCDIRGTCEDKDEEELGRYLFSAKSRWKAGDFKPERAAELRQLGCAGFEPRQKDASATAKDVHDPSVESTNAVRAATPSPSPVAEESNDDEKRAVQKRFNPSQHSWDEVLEKLRGHLAEYGINCRVGGRLGQWWEVQHRRYLAGELQPDRLEKLRTLGRKEFAEKEVDAIKADDTQAESMKADEIRAESIKADDTQAESMKADEIQAESMIGDETQAGSMLVDETQAESMRVDETQAGSEKVDETQAEKMRVDETQAGSKIGDETTQAESTKVL